MVKFIDNIICCSIMDVLDFKKTSQEAPLVNLDKTDEKFALKLYKKSNTVSSKT